jgi:adenine-specific DNA-methyltransferase
MPVLQFKGKVAIENYHNTVPHRVIDLDAKLSVLPKKGEPSLSDNLIIEGDNLQALKSLLPTHAGRIKCIYIDSPYNTGKEGWVFNDNLTQPQFKEWLGQTVGKEGEDATRHDKWCCMMYPRLQLLKQLLKPEGIIFVSIEENEIHHLRMMLDEIFGPENSLGTVVWRNVRDNNPTRIAMEHEYLLAYARDHERVPEVWKNGATSHAKDTLLEFYKAQKKKRLSPEEIEKNLRQFLKDNSATVGELERYKFVDDHGPYTGSESVHNPHPGGYYYEIYHPVTKKPMNKPSNGYRFPESTMKRDYINKDRLIYGPDENRIVKIKLYLEDYQDTLRSVIEIDGRLGNYRLAAIFGKENVFDNPKPVELIKRLLAFATSGSDLVLDSFAGSGTTGHAVLELNQEDGGQRKFVLVQMPYDSKGFEKDKLNICEQITAERVRRVIEGYGKGDKKVDGLGGSFSYGRLGKPLFGEYRKLAIPPPTFQELAKYIFYTETSSEFDAAKADQETGKIGDHSGKAYYLLYSESKDKASQLDMNWLKDTLKREKCKKLVIYCEKLWIQRDDLRSMEAETGVSVRPMLVPFQLK